MGHKYFKVSFFAVPALMVMSSAWADHLVLNFPMQIGKVNFSCTAIADKATMIQMDAHDIDLQGACKGQYVVRCGHLKMPTDVLNSFSFTTNQKSIRAGSITIDTPQNIPVMCIINGTAGRPLFATSDEYC
jgi:hypothetical protein